MSPKIEIMFMKNYFAMFGTSFTYIPLFILFLTNYKFAALCSPRDHDDRLTTKHKGNAAKRQGGCRISDDV
uniref:Uncharacterized protein n=1 Tax=viral metagenome TaxID=1070528 RepID=A0A6C0EX04_9ZZZZ